MTEETNASEAAKALGRLGGLKGGKARAEKLTPDQRSEIARQAVEARWAKKGIKPLLRATHTGILKIGDLELECAVLESGERVISQRAFMRAMGIKYGGGMAAGRTDDDLGAVYPLFLRFKTLMPFVDNELQSVLNNPLKYRHAVGSVAHGIKAELIPRICEVWLKARDAGALRRSQFATAVHADILVRGLAHIGIVALVDEATGYQDARARDALAKVLEAFVAKELRKWIKTFPAEFYKELFRLRGLSYPPREKSEKRPQYIGALTNDIVYERLAPGVLEELKKRNPRMPSGNRKSKHHQWLTDNIGHPKLLQHLSAVIALMKASDSYDGFKSLLDRALPKYEHLPLFDKLPSDSAQGEVEKKSV